MAKRIYKIDSGYSSTSPASYSSMSPQSSQDTPYQDLQSLQLSQVIDCSDLDNNGMDIKCEFVNSKHQNDEFNNNKDVKLKIVEEPVSKFRYRYISEMHGTHGSLMGQNSSKSKKTYPTVELKGFNGEALIRCSLYQIDKKDPHSHRLVVRRNDQDISDPHQLTLNSRDGYRAVFQGMGIIHTAKRDIKDELYLKKKVHAEFEKGASLNLKEDTKLKIDCEKESKKMNLNQVILRYEAYEVIHNKLRLLCEPIYSSTISNMKCALTGELKITRLSTCVSSAAGGDDLFLFVEKVGKKNIKVKFFEVDDNDEITWVDYGIFNDADVHHQYAIALRTPPYKNKNIDDYAYVFIQLERPSDGDVSERIVFKYKPRDCVSSRKRARTCSSGFGSFELPSTINNNDGKSISEEYQKTKILDNLISGHTITSRELEFIDQVQKDSDELLNLWDPNIFETTNQNLELDCHSGGRLNWQNYRRKLNTDVDSDEDDKVIKNMMDNIKNTLRATTINETKLTNIQRKMRILLLEFNDKYEDLLHRIIRTKSTQGIFLLKVLEKLKLYDIVNLTNDDGDNCLHIACTFNSPMFITPLINLGSNPNKQNNKGETPLHIAVEDNLNNCVMKILNNDSYAENGESLNIDLADNNGYTALHIAVRKKNLDIVKMLIEKGNASTKISCSKNGNNAVHLAIEENCPEILKFFLNNSTVKINEKNLFGHTPLSLAQSMGKNGKHLVDIIIEKCDKSTNQLVEDIKFESFSSGESEDHDSIKSDEKVEEHLIDIKCEDYKLNNCINHFEGNLIEMLSKILLENEKWIKLCEHLNLQSYSCLWKTPKAMFNFINESKNIDVHNVIDALTTMNEMEAINCIKNFSC